MNKGGKDARAFVESISRYIRNDKSAETSIPKVHALFDRLSTLSNKERVARVETVQPLSAPQVTELGNILSRFAGYPVSIDNQTSSAILGGIRIRLGDWVYDGTIQYQLSVMAKELLV